MSAAKKGLGRGFESLIPTDLLDDSFDPTAAQDQSVSELKELAIANVHPDPDQPRRYFDEDALNELANSVSIHGVFQPIIVTKDTKGYKIVAGERRYRASLQAGKDTIPAIIRTLDDQNRLEISLIENLQRTDLNPIEVATAYVKLRDQFNLTNEQVGQRLNKSTSAIQNTARLLKLPRSVQALVAEGKLREGQVRPLVSWDAALVEELIPRILAEEWSARKVEQYVVNLKNLLQNPPKPEEQTHATEVQHEHQVASLRSRLDTKVDIRVNAKGAGRIVINFKNGDDLDRIQKLLGE